MLYATEQSDVQSLPDIKHEDINNIFPFFSQINSMPENGT